MTVNGDKTCSGEGCPSSGGSATCPSIPITQCGQSFSLSVNGNSFEYTFKGEKLQVYGAYGPTLGKYNIYVDNEFLIEINQQRDTEEKYSHQYTSELLSYGEHTIRAVGVGETFEIYKFFILAIYQSYSNKYIRIFII